MRITFGIKVRVAGQKNYLQNPSFIYDTVRTHKRIIIINSTYSKKEFRKLTNKDKERLFYPFVFEKIQKYLQKRYKKIDDISTLIFA
ncbi:MAG: hypothetical protein ACTSSF_00185 [Candidatus Heimdallarchaeaceae archaeon]